MTEIFVAVNNHCFPKKESISFQEHVINIEETLESEPIFWNSQCYNPKQAQNIKRC